MKTVINLGDKFKDRIAARYPALQGSDVPDNSQPKPIDHKTDEIKRYQVMFWHRLLKRIYGEPVEIEYELSSTGEQEKESPGSIILRTTGKIGTREVSGISEELASKLDAGEVKPGFPINWKYYVKLPTGGVVTLGTKDRNTVFGLAYISGTDDTEKSEEAETRKFVEILLEEANRLREQLFNPVKEFEKYNKLKLYHINNVYLANYVSGKYMLSMAESEESDLTSEWLKFDARTDDWFDDEKKRTSDQFGLARGMFYFSAISYFFMALEGFVNIVFHTFLKKDLRDRDLNLDQRLDLEQKLKLMASLCHGFNEDAQLSSTVYAKFKQLKNYRNSLFHSKIGDSLKTLCFLEDGFFYTYNKDIDDCKERFLPFDKGGLTVNDVTKAKTVVDEIIGGLLNSMEQGTRMLVEKYILNETTISFFTSESGDLLVTTEGKEMPPKSFL